MGEHTIKLKSGALGGLPSERLGKALNVPAIIAVNGSHSLSALALTIDPHELRLVAEPSLRAGARVTVSFTLPIGGRNHLVRGTMTVLRVAATTQKTVEVFMDMQDWPSHQAALLHQFLST